MILYNTVFNLVDASIHLSMQPQDYAEVRSRGEGPSRLIRDLQRSKCRTHKPTGLLKNKKQTIKQTNSQTNKQTKHPLQVHCAKNPRKETKHVSSPRGDAHEDDVRAFFEQVSAELSWEELFEGFGWCRSWKYFLFSGFLFVFLVYTLRESSVLPFFGKRGFFLFDVLFGMFCSTC